VSNLNKKIKPDFDGNAAPPAPAGAYPVTIETPRLILREIEKSDAPAILAITQKPGFHYYCFDGTQNTVDAFIQSAIDTRKTNPDGMRDEIMLAVTLKDTGELIGHVALQRVSHVPGYPFDANFFIDPDKQNKGYGREALINMKHYGYEKLDQKGYTITVHPDNHASQHVFLSEGYGHIKDTFISTVNGKEPRMLLFQSKDQFYKQRALDKRPLLLPKAANENSPVPSIKPVKGGPKP
jgi:RimJ/RimL family protein N-acetyltransferase